MFIFLNSFIKNTINTDIDVIDAGTKITKTMHNLIAKSLYRNSKY